MIIKPLLFVAAWLILLDITGITSRKKKSPVIFTTGLILVYLAIITIKII